MRDNVIGARSLQSDITGDLIIDLYLSYSSRDEWRPIWTYYSILYYAQDKRIYKKIAEFSKSLKLENEGRVYINNLKVMQK